SEGRRDPLVGHCRPARTNLIGIHHDCGYRRATRYRAPAPPDRVLARWDSMVRVRSRWTPCNDGACHFHPARCRGVLRYLRAAILFGLPACLHLDGSLRRTAFRGTRLDRLRAASFAAITWSFDRRPDSIVSLSNRTRKLRESRYSRIRVNAGAYCGYARTNGLSGGGRNSV